MAAEQVSYIVCV